MNYKQSEFKEAVIKRCQENMANAGVQAYTAEGIEKMSWSSCWSSDVPERCVGLPGPVKELSQWEEERWARGIAGSLVHNRGESPGIRNLAKCALRWDREARDARSQK